MHALCCPGSSRKCFAIYCYIIYLLCAFLVRLFFLVGGIDLSADDTGHGWCSHASRLRVFGDLRLDAEGVDLRYTVQRIDVTKHHAAPIRDVDNKTIENERSTV